MSWLLVIALALAALAFAVLVLRLPRGGWSLFASALMFGLAGYALQGSPDLPSAPASAQPGRSSDGAALVEARRAFFDGALPSRYVVSADAFAREGRWVDAAGFLRNAVHEEPRDAEAWLGLGIALVEQAEGQLTPAAELAFRRSREASNGGLAPSYFLGLSLLRRGDIGETRQLWAAALAAARPDAPGRAILTERAARLDAILAAMAADARVEGASRR